jgi:polar amino acid transport system substrate-binding protein
MRWLHITLWMLWIGMASAQTAPLHLVTQAYSPYIVQQNQDASGLAVDIVKEVFRRSGKEIDIAFYPWSRALYMLDHGQADGLFTIKKTPERERQWLYPQEALLSQDYVFFARKTSTFRFNGDLSSLAQTRIGVVQNTSYGARFDQAAATGHFLALDAAHNYELTFRKLLGGRVDAVICSHLVGLEILKALGAQDLVEVRGPVVETAVSYLVFSRSEAHRTTAALFDRHLAAMKIDGTIHKMTARYRAQLRR